MTVAYWRHQQRHYQQ